MILAPTEQIIADIRAGRMVILVDDENRENEGDLVIAAESCTPDAINFMAREACGLICLALTKSRVEELGLPLMAQHNGTRHQTAFTVSIEARTGVTTGISAADRAHTVQVASNPCMGRHDIVSPGHIFPLMARDGGVLVRAGHTEAGVDLARLAGMIPAAVICEIMNLDGSMARLPQLLEYAAKHNLNIGSIADLIAWRRRRERIVQKVWEGEGQHPPFTTLIYRNQLDGVEHMALVLGDIPPAQPVLVRVQVLNIWQDVIGVGDSLLSQSLTHIEQQGAGVLVLLRDPLPDSLSRSLRPEGHAENALRDYGLGAQILLDIGVREMVLLTNSGKKNIVGLDGYDLHVADVRSI